MDISSISEFAELVSGELGESVHPEKMRRIERGDRDVEYALLRAIANVVRDSVADETSTPLEWLAGAGDPVRVNPGSLKTRWAEYVIPGQETFPELQAVAGL